jgi:hypothetical protein
MEPGEVSWDIDSSNVFVVNVFPDSIPGPPGPTGPSGPAGPTGATGAAGATGPAGVAGSTDPLIGAAIAVDIINDAVVIDKYGLVQPHTSAGDFILYKGTHPGSVIYTFPNWIIAPPYGSGVRYCQFILNANPGPGPTSGAGEGAGGAGFSAYTATSGPPPAGLTGVSGVYMYPVASGVAGVSTLSPAVTLTFTVPGSSGPATIDVKPPILVSPVFSIDASWYLVIEQPDQENIGSGGFSNRLQILMWTD